MKVYLVEDVFNSPGRVLAVFANEEDVVAFVESANLGEVAEISERTLFYGQPPNPGYNE
jgi:hypothetical protein